MMCLPATGFCSYLSVFLAAWLIPDAAYAWMTFTKHQQRSLCLRPLSTSLSLPELSLYNSLTRTKQVLKPVHPSAISLYTCGPTVYDYAHIGNFRAFLTYDVLKRVLLYLGYAVDHVCNLTDVDDKIIARANQQQLASISTLTRHYEKLFMQDLQALNIIPANHYPRATEYIAQMMDMIMILAKKGLAYETSDGSWYFRTQQQPGYGQQLVQLNYDDMMTEAASDSCEEKEHFADFCLWKAFKEGFDRLDTAWKSDTIQLGRPGWHLECSAMARSLFGDETIDLHGGGIDLKFPHHENEIAQSQGVTDATFCNCWFHNGFVNFNDEKMSKSLGNFLTLRTACPTADDVRAYRYLVVSSQYRNPLAFTPQAIQAAKNAIKRIDKVMAGMEQALQGASSIEGDGEVDDFVAGVLQDFEAAIRDDLSMPRASAALFALVKEAENEFKRVAKDESESLDFASLASRMKGIKQMDKVFGIFYQVPLSAEEQVHQSEDVIPTDVVELVTQRLAAKEAKDWELADSLRARIAELGFAVKDVKGGAPIISRVESSS